MIEFGLFLYLVLIIASACVGYKGRLEGFKAVAFIAPGIALIGIGLASVTGQLWVGALGIAAGYKVLIYEVDHL